MFFYMYNSFWNFVQASLYFQDCMGFLFIYLFIFAWCFFFATVLLGKNETQ